MKWSEEVGRLFAGLRIKKEQGEKAAILFLLGIFFLLVATPMSSLSDKKIATEGKESAPSEETEIVVVTDSEKDAYILQLENKLEQIIGGMEGAGKVRVMITLKDTGQKILDKNQPYESETDSGPEGEETHKNIRNEQETVILQKDGEETPIVVSELYPGIEGVVVVCEGGDDTLLVLQIKEAVEALFSIDAHKIVVCKLQ